MRKIDKKNKLSFNVFGILIVAFLAVFAATGIQVLKKGEQEYYVSTGSVVYDEGMSRVDMASSGTAKKRWDGKYYLSLENGGNYCLGAHNVMYDTGNGELSIIGDTHQVFTDGSVRNLKGKTLVENKNEISFFKLDDRNYLLSAPEIRSDEQGFATKDYVQVNIDKSGNALLTNEEVNMKTVEPMVLTSGEVTFDIANELLVYREQKVDLKAINGSTNEYEPPEEPKKETEEDANDDEKGGSDADNTASGSIVNNTTSNSSTNNANATNNSQDVVVNNSGSGSGSGNNTGDGNNSGSGNNTGDGNNSGSGNNTGDGNNSGSGNNTGDGNNSGSGNNTGDGNNSGSGNNTGDGNNSGSGNNTGDGNNSGSGNNSGTGNNQGSGNNSGSGNNTGSGNNQGTENNQGSGNNQGTGNNTGNGTGNSDKPGNLDRAAALRGTTSDVISITVNYYIMDPENKYVSTYLLVSEDGSEEVQRIELSKADTSMTVRGLKPNTQYRITLGYDMYVIIDGESELSENTDDVVKARTKAIKSSVKINKITAEKIQFTVELDESHLLDAANVCLYGDGEARAAQMPIDIKKASRGGFTASFMIEDAFQGENPSQYVLTVEDATYQGEAVPLNAKCITKNMGITRFIDSLLRGFN